MSHWIESFTLVEAEGGAALFRPKDSNWSLDSAEWTSDSLVKMQLRKYPGDHKPSSFEVVIDCESQTARAHGGDSIPLRELDEALECLYGTS